MVMAHASGLDASCFHPLARALSPRECIRAEFVGYPHGGPLPTEPVLAADAERLEQIIAEAERPVHLFGHSYGGRVALEVARRGRAELETLLVFEPVIQSALPHRETADWLDVSDGYEGFLSQLTDYWGGAGTWKSLSAGYRSQQMRRAARVHLEVSALCEDVAGPEDWRFLSLPVLVIRGDHAHQDSEQMCDALLAALPSADLVVVPDSGHMAPVTDPATIGMVIKTWLGLR